jgi:anthranilate synthase component 2
MNSPFTAARYHSLVIEKESFPHDALEITAWTEDGLVMAARHKKYKHIQVLLNSMFHSTSFVVQAQVIHEVFSRSSR